VNFCRMDHKDITGEIISSCIFIHQSLGPGLFESVYREILAYELQKRGLTVKQEIPIPVIWEGIKMEIGYRADLIVEGKVLVELKSLEKIHPVHSKQLLTYIKLLDIRVGLLINFGSDLLKNGITRMVNNY
jgi:GxxExxY protein